MKLFLEESQYLKENKHRYNIKKACKTLNISRSGLL
ncbi:helix-turn-helix domain-containing protein [Bacillus cereus]